MAKTEKHAGVDTQGSWKWLLGVILLPVVLLFGWAAVKAAHEVGTPEGQARARERDAIDRCREAVADELQELATRRFMRQACEQLERDFRAKWDRAP